MWGAVVMVGREREVKGKNTTTAHYFITSLRTTAKKLAGYIRSHWEVENGLHWCLDVSFREDANRTRDRNAGANLGIVRRVAASLLKQDKGRGSIKAKRFGAALDEKYLEQVLQGFTANSMRWPCPGACRAKDETLPGAITPVGARTILVTSRDELANRYRVVLDVVALGTHHPTFA